MSSKGVKRASPGAEAEKNPLGDVELTDEDAVKLQAIQKDVARVELALERRAQEKMVPVYEKRRAVVKAIAKFWPVALMNHGMLALHVQHNSDQAALSYLEDLWIVRDPEESRCFTLEFYFKENPYFSNTVLKKEYKYLAPPVEGDDKPDADGITETMVEFSWERDVQPQATKIDWKDEAKNLTKLHPRVVDEDDDLPSEGGSFFNFFEVAQDPFDIGVTIANDVFPEAIEYFLGHAGGDDVDSDEEDDDSEDDDNEDEIDLEKPRPKKQKQA
ncbi:Nucleosome assembly protein 1-like 4 [Trametes pubescens]|uniref:Nucleosome assembly protein 1-like 4 n=1 Tax=Trametes pubescens TaxID=154538 RepID=A0A1M2VB63_TRAPU|nr:Nucleosome assembly protein 1-like 4 [Trametes pubescens]